MKTQISRLSHDPQKRYSGVYQQQGRMITDADWNELVDVLREHLKRALGEVVGSGIPRLARLQVIKDGGMLKLQPGAVYVDGLRGEVLGTQSIDFTAQSDFPGAPALPATGCLYVDLWERTVVSLEDASLRDAGLHGADTCTRTQTMVQIKACDASRYLDADGHLTSEMQNLRCGDAVVTQLSLWSAASAGERTDPCVTQTGEPARVGNYLFRLEVHHAELTTSGAAESLELTLKWSSENASEAQSLVWQDDEGHTTLGYQNLPPGFLDDHWTYELYNDRCEKQLGVHLRSGFSPSRGRLVSFQNLPQTPTLENGEDALYIRRWDGTCKLRLKRASATGNWQPDLNPIEGVDKAQPLSTDTEGYGYVEFPVSGSSTSFSVSLESLLLTLRLGNSRFIPGDAWLAMVRENAEYRESEGGTVEVDRRVELLGGGKPLGIVHHYLEIARLSAGDIVPEVDGGTQDRRLDFPPLTDLTAESIGYNPTAQGARWDDINESGGPRRPLTVQEAIDDLASNLDASDLEYCLPVQASTSYGAQNLNQLIRGDIAGLVTRPDGRTWTKLDAFCDALLCKLDASRLPYDPTVKAERWKDIREVSDLGSGASMTPSTIQQALDQIVEGLESTDIVYRVPTCAQTGLTVRSGLGLTSGSTVKIDAVLDKLLCNLNATVLPLDQNDTSLAAMLRDPSVASVQQALTLLANRILGQGCAVTVGPGGQYATISEAVAALAGLSDVSLCLLPGVQQLPSGLRLAGKRTIKLVGVGERASSVRLGAPLELSADEVILRNIDFDTKPNASVVVKGARVTANDNHFERHTPWSPEVWSKGFLGTLDFSRVAVGPKGNLILAGSFVGLMDLGYGSLGSSGKRSIFLAGFDHDGVCKWTKAFGASQDISFHAVMFNKAGDVLVTGDFRGTTDFGAGPVTSATSGSTFAAAFDVAGRHRWSKSFASPGFPAPSVTVDDTENLIVVGQKGAPWISKVAPSGQTLWGREIYGDSKEVQLGRILVDEAGEIVLVGSFKGSMSFGGGPTLTSAGFGLFLVKLDPNGNHLWSRSFPTTVGTSPATVQMALDRDGSIVLAGAFSNPSRDFGGGALTNAGVFEIYVARFDSLGQHLWSKCFGGGGMDSSHDVTIDGSGNIVLTGEFSSAKLSFGGHELQRSAPYADIYAARFDRDGRHLWSRGFGGSSGRSLPSITVDPDGQILLTGRFFANSTSRLNFGGADLSLPSFGDAFYLAKLRSLPSPPALLQVRSPDGGATSLDCSGNTIRSTIDESYGAVWPASAIALSDYQVSGHVNDNEMVGNLILSDSFHPQVTAPLPVEFGTTSVGGKGELFIRGNRLHRIVSKYEFGAPNLDAYESLVVTDNVFDDTGSNFIASAVTWSNNQLRKALQPSDRAGVIVARTATITGNQAHHPEALLVLIILSRYCEAANLLRFSSSHLSFYYGYTLDAAEWAFDRGVGGDLLWLWP